MVIYVNKNNKEFSLNDEIINCTNVTCDIKLITNKIETEFHKITQYLKSKYPTEIGQSMYKSYYMNVRCGVICDVNSGSSIVQDIFKFLNPSQLDIFYSLNILKQVYFSNTTK